MSEGLDKIGASITSKSHKQDDSSKKNMHKKK